jgi:hypothetical protein
MASVFREFDTVAYPFRFAGTLHVATMLGGIPSNDKVAEGWLRTKIQADDDIIRKMVAETMVERGVGDDEALKIVNEMKNLNGFKRDKTGLYYEGRCLKAALKEAVSIAVGAGKLEQRGWGTTKKFITSYVPEHVFVEENELHLYRDGVRLTEADEVRQQFVHSRYGSSIAYTELVRDVDIHFTVVTDHDFAKKDWAMIWLTSERNGVSAGRSMGFGRHEVSKWERISSPAHRK